MNLKSLKKVSKRKLAFFIKPIIDFFRVRDIRNRTLYAKYYEKYSVVDNYVLYESRDGQSMTDSPYAIFKYMLQNPKGKDYVHIWSLSNREYLKDMEEKYRQHTNVKFVLRNSRDYLKSLSKCKYLINNSTFQNIYTVKDEQVYINTWHGTPLKNMGYDMEGVLPTGPSNVVRNFLSTDYILSPNTFTTEIFNSAFKLENLYEGQILEDGYPRIDLTVNTTRDEVTATLTSENIDVGDKKIILYAPTWKGDTISKPRNDIEQIHEDISKVEAAVGGEYKVLVKVHPFLYKYAVDSPLLEGRLVSDTFETNELLAATDILITDYSSIFFDFLVTRRPILFYMWDFDDYKSNRGMYIETDHLPGPICKDVDSLINSIEDIEGVQEEYQANYQSFIDKFCYQEYGNVTETIINKVFNSAPAKASSNNKKEKILMYPGGLRNNGITGAAIGLLDNIDYSRYDVTLLVNYTHNQEILNNMLRVNPNVRLAFKIGRINQTIYENYSNYVTRNRGISSNFLERIFPWNMYKREYKRIVGKSKFDYIIDYSGYSMFWPNILLAGEAKKKMIFMHSDLYSDMNRKVNGKRPHFINLRGVFSLYKYFDELVSVSEATMKVNKERLKSYIGDTKISYVINSINPKKIKQLSQDDTELYYKDQQPVLVNARVNRQRRLEIENIPVPVEGDGYTNYINMGRLSPEKGQDQLIEAFAEVHKKYKHTRLYIVGEGPMRPVLERLIQTHQLEDSVFLTGHKSNPFYLMNKCDAFILSSHYEGQPLVLLESLTLGLHTIGTDIVANRYVLEDGKYGMLVENSVAGIAGGMLAVIEQELPRPEFDAEKYNEAAMASFYEKLDK